MRLNGVVLVVGSGHPLLLYSAFCLLLCLLFFRLLGLALASQFTYRYLNLHAQKGNYVSASVPEVRHRRRGRRTVCHLLEGRMWAAIWTHGISLTDGQPRKPPLLTRTRILSHTPTGLAIKVYPHRFCPLSFSPSPAHPHRIFPFFCCPHRFGRSRRGAAGKHRLRNWKEAAQRAQGRREELKAQNCFKSS
jgi:hypothetical protein